MLPPPYKSASSRGFTLVELSIVLVIIGLLIGGILVAQSMIATANITATIKQIQQFDAGVENFKTKYKYLPGDAPQFGGNGDGMLTALSGDNQVFVGEIANFWNDWNSALYASATWYPPGGPAVYSNPGQNVPVAKFGKANSFFIASWSYYIGSGNYYAILDSSQVQQISQAGSYHFKPTTSANNNSAVKPVELLALDTKIDDGIANTGNVLSGEIDLGNGYSSTTFGSIGDLYPIPACSSGGPAYNLTTSPNAYVCTPLIHIGAQTGDPQ